MLINGRGETVEMKKAGVFSSDELSGFINEFIIETGVVDSRKSGKGWQGGWRVRGELKRERKRSVNIITRCIFGGEQVEEEFVVDTTIHVRSIRRMKKVIKRVQVGICVMW